MILFANTGVVMQIFYLSESSHSDVVYNRQVKSLKPLTISVCFCSAVFQICSK